MTTRDVKLTITVTVQVADTSAYGLKWKSSPTERVEALFSYGTTKDAFDAVGLTQVDTKVREVGR